MTMAGTKSVALSQSLTLFGDLQAKTPRKGSLLGDLRDFFPIKVSFGDQFRLVIATGSL